MTNHGTILVVDDESESLRLLTNILQADGYEVRPADTGELALESVRAKAPDLILLDIRMPGLDGLEVCRRLKARTGSRGIPSVFLSASQTVEERVEGLQLGAVDFISKPFRSEELLARVRTHLELGRLRAALEARVAERTAELVAANEQLQLDLVERMRAEEALRESEERFRNMADTAPVMIWVAGTDKLCTFYSKGWLVFTGRTMEQELGNGWAESVHPDDLGRCYSTYSSSFDAHQEFQMEYRLRRADGEYRWVLDNGIPRFATSSIFVGYIGSCIDVTDLKRNQEQLLATQKLESLGVLTAGIAHDFNNMLASIFAEADLALSEIPPDSHVRGNLDRISAVAMRGSEVLNLMMDYAGGKGDSAELEPVDLCFLIEEMIEFLKVSISKKAVFETSLSKHLPSVLANPTQIQRLLMNLLTNASEALDDQEGLIRIATTTVRTDSGSRTSSETNLREGTYVLVEITDTGRGMTEQEQSKVFDPFYTTKSVGRGLGLSAAQGILRSHGGSIQVMSALGRGSTFKVFLPCNDSPAKKQRYTVLAAVDEPAPIHETVLLVEDEETLRLAVSLSLEKNGFSVIAAGEGHAAVDLFRARAQDIDVVLLDLTLPGMSGAEVFREVRRIRPEVRIVLTSAYDRERISIGSEFGETTLYTFIRKPYRIGELVRTLRRALSESVARACPTPI